MKERNHEINRNVVIPLDFPLSIMWHLEATPLDFLMLAQFLQSALSIFLLSVPPKKLFLTPK